jgi:hypothetical protein
MPQMKLLMHKVKKSCGKRQRERETSLVHKQLKVNDNYQIQQFTSAKHSVVYDLDRCHPKALLKKAKLLFHTYKKQPGSLPQPRKLLTITQ